MLSIWRTPRAHHSKNNGNILTTWQQRRSGSNFSSDICKNRKCRWTLQWYENMKKELNMQQRSKRGAAHPLCYVCLPAACTSLEKVVKNRLITECLQHVWFKVRAGCAQAHALQPHFAIQLSVITKCGTECTRGQTYVRQDLEINAAWDGRESRCVLLFLMHVCLSYFYLAKIVKLAEFYMFELPWI